MNSMLFNNNINTTRQTTQKNMMMIMLIIAYLYYLKTQQQLTQVIEIGIKLNNDETVLRTRLNFCLGEVVVDFDSNIIIIIIKTTKNIYNNS